MYRKQNETTSLPLGFVVRSDPLALCLVGVAPAAPSSSGCTRGQRAAVGAAAQSKDPPKKQREQNRT